MAPAAACWTARVLALALCATRRARAGAADADWQEISDALCSPLRLELAHRARPRAALNASALLGRGGDAGAWRACCEACRARGWCQAWQLDARARRCALWPRRFPPGPARHAAPSAHVVTGTVARRARALPAATGGGESAEGGLDFGGRALTPADVRAAHAAAPRARIGFVAYGEGELHSQMAALLARTARAVGGADWAVAHGPASLRGAAWYGASGAAALRDSEACRRSARCVRTGGMFAWKAALIERALSAFEAFEAEAETLSPNPNPNPNPNANPDPEAEAAAEAPPRPPPPQRQRQPLRPPPRAAAAPSRRAGAPSAAAPPEPPAPFVVYADASRFNLVGVQRSLRPLVAYLELPAERGGPPARALRSVLALYRPLARPLPAERCRQCTGRACGGLCVQNCLGPGKLHARRTAAAMGLGGSGGGSAGPGAAPNASVPDPALARYMAAPMWQASFSVWRRSARTLGLAREWARWASEPEAALRSSLGDQAVLSFLLARRGYVGPSVGRWAPRRLESFESKDLNTLLALVDAGDVAALVGNGSGRARAAARGASPGEGCARAAADGAGPPARAPRKLRPRPLLEWPRDARFACAAAFDEPADECDTPQS